MDFILFVILNGILLIRPEEVIPGLAGFRLYLLCVIPCTLVALPKLLHLLTYQELSRRPTTCCVLIYFVAFVISSMIRGRTEDMIDLGGEFAKVILYYLLTVSIIDTPYRLKTLLAWIGVFATVVAGIALLDYFEYYDVESITHPTQWYFNKEIGEMGRVSRLASSGMFGDPNDLCLLLIMGSYACIYRSTIAENLVFRLLWLSPLGVFGYAFVLTQSRGGMLAFLASVVAYMYAWFGPRKAIILAAIMVPAIVLLVGGRQADISSGDTANERMNLWSYGLSEILRGPFAFIFGIGAGQYSAMFGQVAHNSYIHAYVELGIFGGTFFLVAFLVTGRIAVSKPGDKSEWVVPFHRYLIPIFIGYAAGAYSLSRCYVLPTFLVLGIAEAYIIASATVVPQYSFVNALWFRRAFLIGFCGLIFLKFFTQFAMTGL